MADAPPAPASPYNQVALISTAIIFTAIGFALVCLRFWMRLSYRKTFLGLDDWLILAGSILVAGMAVNEILSLTTSYLGALGMDGQMTKPGHSVTQTKLDYATVIYEKIAYGAIKLSVLFFYRRIFTIPKFRVVNNYLIALTVVWAVAFCLADAFVCGVHAEAQWDPVAKRKYHCINVYIVLVVFAITDVATDIVILITPYPQIKKLQMTKKEKWGLAGIFLLGTITLSSASLALPAVASDFNPPLNTAPTFWTVVEVSIGVTAANLPSLAPLFRDMIGKKGSIFSAMRRKPSHSGGSSSGGNAAAPNSPTNFTASTEGTRIGSFDTAMFNAQSDKEGKHRSEHVAMWEQFDRINRMESEESQARKPIGEKARQFV